MINHILICLIKQKKNMAFDFLEISEELRNDNSVAQQTAVVLLFHKLKNYNEEIHYEYNKFILQDDFEYIKDEHTLIINNSYASIGNTTYNRFLSFLICNLPIIDLQKLKIRFYERTNLFANIVYTFKPFDYYYGCRNEKVLVFNYNKFYKIIKILQLYNIKFENIDINIDDGLTSLCSYVKYRKGDIFENSKIFCESIKEHHDKIIYDLKSITNNEL